MFEHAVVGRVWEDPAERYLCSWGIGGIGAPSSGTGVGSASAGGSSAPGVGGVGIGSAHGIGNIGDVSMGGTVSPGTPAAPAPASGQMGASTPSMLTALQALLSGDDSPQASNAVANGFLSLLSPVPIGMINGILGAIMGPPTGPSTPGPGISTGPGGLGGPGSGPGGAGWPGPHLSLDGSNSSEETPIQHPPTSIVPAHTVFTPAQRFGSFREYLDNRLAGGRN